MAQIHLPRIVPVFPLPEVVLFPRTLLRLHVFEPRYRALTADALAGDGIIGIALLRPGYEPLYETLEAPIHSVIGVGRIARSEQLDTGRYNLLLQGLARAEVREEQPAARYRRAAVEVVESYSAASLDEEAALRLALRDRAAENAALEPDLRQRWMDIIEAESDLDVLTDLLSGSLPAEAELRQVLLREPDVPERARIVIQHLETLDALARRRRGPRDSSLN